MENQQINITNPDIQGRQIHLLSDYFTTVLPRVHASNPYCSYLEENLLPEQHPFLQPILDLSNQLAILYRHNRIQLGAKHVETCMEDVSAAIGLMQCRISPLSVLRQGAFYSYRQLRGENFTAFKRKEAMRATGYSKSHMQRLLDELHNTGLICKQGNKHTGFIYSFK